MSPRFELLRTRVARRILLLFVLGALAPVVVLAAYSFIAVTDQLREQSRDRLQQLSKSAGMSVLERLQDAETDLSRAAGAADPRSLLRVVVTPRHAPPASLPLDVVWSEDEWAKLREGGTLLRVDDGGAGGGALWLVRLRDVGEAASPLVWGQVDSEYLWTSADQYVALPSIAGFCILADLARRLHCARAFGSDVAAGMIDAFRTSPTSDGRGVFHWSTDGADYVGSHWELFLRGAFEADAWTVLVSESESAVYAPLRRFALAFPPVLLFGLLVVALLANAQVRRTMEPLEKLTDGTRRIAAKDFETRVGVDSDDEFGELARSFNTMAERLGVQFRHLEASRAIDQAVLSASRGHEVVGALLGGFGSVVPYDRLAVLILERDQKAGSMHWMAAGAPHEASVRPTEADVVHLAALVPHATGLSEAELPPMMRGFVGGEGPALVLPLLVKGEVRGALMVGRARPFDAEELVRARQIVDQAAVALDEVQLVSELEEMSWGTLRALARAIDAKSRWTAGHSERVVRLALRVGREMDLAERELATLERGGLLHDVGKIGIPARLLDFEGHLSIEERDVMRKHVTIGASILEPVAAYADAVPIVLHHHERWDGTGYPHGLAGEAIPLLARVLAVADAYDAMASARPYRTPLPADVVLERIQRGAGSHFDPRVVAALMRVRSHDVDLSTSGPGAAQRSEAAAHG